VSNSGSFIVALDTSSPRGSIALAVGGRLAAAYGLETDAPQSVGLWENVDMLMVRTGKSVHDVTAVAVARGPGSFTGLRVGLAAATGFARALDRPLYGATTLELTARSSGAAASVWVLLNAHRGELYAQRFAVGRDGAVAAQSDAIVASPDAVVAMFDEGPLRVVGDGVDLAHERIADAARHRGIVLERTAVAAPPGPGWQVATSRPFLAGELAVLASEWEAEGRTGHDVEPFYVRPSQAEVNLRSGLLGRIDVVGGS
jgi:tRNA threonylcarbamoyladenosine biosynthesis protein TsaB